MTLVKTFILTVKWVYLLMIHKHLVRIISLFNITLDNIYKWIKTRKLDLNPTKCKILRIKKNKPFNPIDLIITKIPTVKVFKDLGIYISASLKSNGHINYLCNVLRVSIYQTSKSFKTSSATILTKLFKKYVSPKLEYNYQFRSPFIKKKEINNFKSVQRNFTDLVCSRCNISN